MYACNHGPARLRIVGKRKLPTFAHQFRLIHFVDSRHYLPGRHVVFVRRRWDVRPGACTNGIESRYFHDLLYTRHFGGRPHFFADLFDTSSGAHAGSRFMT